MRLSRRLVLALVVPLLALVAALYVVWPADPVAMRPAPPVPLLDRPLRIAVMGTSLTARYRWPDELAAILSRCMPQPVQLQRFAESGQGSDWGEQEAQQVRRFNPDLVLIEFLANDADILSLRTIGGSRASHARIIATLQSRGARPVIVLVTTSPAAGPRGVVRFRLPRFNAMYAALAQDQALGLVDTVPRWRTALEENPWVLVMPDGLHPTQEWQSRVMLAELVAALADALDDAYPSCHGLKPD